MIVSDNIKRWYVLHTKSRFENVVNDILLKKSLEPFLPKIRVKSRRKDRNAVISVPLFPGYVFIKTNLEANEHLNIVKTAGVVKFIGFKNGPIAIPETSIESLKIMVAAELPVTTGSQFEKGDRVMVVNGPFTGAEGFFSRYGNIGRIVVNLEVLNQFAAVEISENDVEPLPKILA